MVSTVKIGSTLSLLSLMAFSGASYAESCAAGGIGEDVILGESSSRNSAFFSASSSEFAESIWVVTGSVGGTLEVQHSNSTFDSTGEIFDSSLNSIAFNDDGFAEVGAFRLENVEVEANSSYCIEVQHYGDDFGPWSGQIEVNFEAEVNRGFPACTIDSEIYGYYPSDYYNDAEYLPGAVNALVAKLDVAAAGTFTMVGSNNNDGTERNIIAIPAGDSGTRIAVPSTGKDLSVGEYCIYEQRAESDLSSTSSSGVSVFYSPDENIYQNGTVQITAGSDISLAENVGTIVQELAVSEPLRKDVEISYELGAATATPELDFRIASGSFGTLTIPAGESSVSYSIEILDDAIEENAEQFELKYSPAQYFSEYFGSTVIVINDDDAPALVNRAPQFSGANFPANATVGELYSYTVTATDLDGDQISYRLGNNPGWMAIDSSTGLISGEPSASGVLTNIQVYAMDGSSGEALVEFNLTVAELQSDDSGPVFTRNDLPSSLVSGDTYSYTVEAVSADGQEVRYELNNAPTWMTINHETGFVTGVAGAAATHENIQITAVSQNGIESTTNFSVLVKTQKKSGCSIATGGFDYALFLVMILALLGLKRRKLS